MIDIEVQAFLDLEYERVLSYLLEHAEIISEDEEETLVYANGLRVEKRNEVVIKKAGLSMHVENAEKARELLALLGQEPQVVWKKSKKKFSWRSFLAELTKAEGFGSMLTLQASCEEEDQIEVRDKLKSLLQELNLTPATPQEFEKHFAVFKENN